MSDHFVTPIPKAPKVFLRSAGGKKQAKPKKRRLEPVEMQLQAWRDAIHERAQRRCQARCNENCTGRSVHAHHIRLTKQGGLDLMDNGLAVCSSCHDFIHAHSTLSFQVGWRRRANPRPGDFHFEGVDE